MITYKYRLYPNKQQQKKLWLHANKLNWLYNKFLDQKMAAYTTEGKSLSRYDLQKQIVGIKQNDAILQEIHSQVIQQVTLRLDTTYKDFFRRGFGFPNFRSCRNFFGICYPQSGYSIKKKVFHTKVYGNIKFVKHRDIEGKIKTVTITCQGDKWYLCIVTDFTLPKTGDGIIGIDVGITNIAALSDGTIVKNKRHAKYFDKQIALLKSRRDTKCKKGSRKFRHLSRIIQRLYGAKCRKINDFQHKVSKRLSSQYDTIVVEKLDIKKMSEGYITGLNRELRNISLSQFMSKLAYKARQLLHVDPQNTSKQCNNCGKMQNMPLRKRVYECTCGYKEDRDVNAAKNILCLGQAMLSSMCSI